MVRQLLRLFVTADSGMEITMRTDAGIDAIKAVKASNPRFWLGRNGSYADKCKESVDTGAEFIVARI